MRKLFFLEDHLHLDLIHFQPKIMTGNWYNNFWSIFLSILKFAILFQHFLFCVYSKFIRFCWGFIECFPFSSSVIFYKKYNSALEILCNLTRTNSHIFIFRLFKHISICMFSDYILIQFHKVIITVQIKYHTRELYCRVLIVRFNASTLRDHSKTLNMFC